MYPMVHNVLSNNCFISKYDYIMLRFPLHLDLGEGQVCIKRGAVYNSFEILKH